MAASEERRAPSGERGRRRRWWTRRWARLLALYLAALLLSHLVRWRSAEPAVPAAGPAVEVPAVEVPAVGGGGTVRLAYREWGGGEATAKPVVLLLHGSPGQASNFDRLGPLLADGYRVIALDLPGFGASSRDVPDYSILAHARYAIDFLRLQGIERAHVVGFSMGGGVALHMADLEPRRVSSLVMLSAIGVQELELLGEYHLNHAIHGLQLAGLWLLFEAVPHFGVLDDFGLDLPYARNFYDTDQRPLRGLLEAFAGPMLIVHGRGDVLVPYEAAVEHHRLVPQSELVSLDANHFMVFTSPGRLAEPLLELFARVEAGEAVTRGRADPERVRAAADPRGFQPARKTGLAWLVTLALIAVATLLSEDLACIAAGLLVAQGSLGFVAATVACFLGIFLGDLGLYGLGRLGRPGLRRAPLRWVLSQSELERSQRWFERRGAWVILASRFVPGMRLPTYVGAGLLRMNPGWFALNLLIPVALWTPLLVGTARLVGERFFQSFEAFQSYALPGFVALLATVWILLATIRSLASYRGRRSWVGWWHRLRHWEFWSRWVFYPPIAIYVLWLGIKHRGLAVFTAANPGVPAAGGFHGESKAEILRRLAPEWVARFVELPCDDSVSSRLATVESFLREHGLDYPLVLKPDQGLRGVGVAVVESAEEAESYLRQAAGDVLAQEYVGGPELAIFYLRIPGEERGRIFSLTHKVRPRIVGDGRSTLERLILADPRAVALARVYFRIQAADLDRVPAAGEEVQLVEIGSHSGGVVCLDGARYLTPRLEDAVERLSRSYEGFYFGRFDCRAPSLECFQEGRDFKVLELNGVTSEATHVYDRRYGLGDAYRVFFEQWRLAFEIGARNRDRGIRPATLRELAALLW